MRRVLMRQRGVSLVEVAVMLAITGVLLAVGMPYYGEYAVNTKLREAGNGMLTEAMAAQSEAIRRNGIVRVSIAGQSVQVLDMNNGGAVLRSRDLGQNMYAYTANIDFRGTGAVATGEEFRVPVTLMGQSCSMDTRCPALKVEAGGGMKLCSNHLVTTTC